MRGHSLLSHHARGFGIKADPEAGAGFGQQRLILSALLGMDDLGTSTQVEALMRAKVNDLVHSTQGAEGFGDVVDDKEVLNRAAVLA